MEWLKRFVVESNRIEGIAVTRQREVDAHRDFIALPAMGVDDLVALVGVLQPDAVLRSRIGLNVRVGSHIPPAGGREIKTRLEELLAFLPRSTPFQNHVAYETLHPFTDGNGRSGRALWLWQMHNSGAYHHQEIGFLRSFYFQTLEAGTSGRTETG